MFPALHRRSVTLLAIALILALATARLNSEVVKKLPETSNTNKAKDDPFPGLTIKSFQGILTGPGSVGTLEKLGYIDFRCDPRSVNWHIKVVDKDKNGNGFKTRFMGNPGVCDHVEVLMYYDPNITDGFNGIAISVKRIP